MSLLITSVFLVASITFAVCVTSIFKWLRELVSKIHPKLEELIHCPFCLGFWVSLAMVIFTKIPVLHYTDLIVVDMILTAFSIMGAAAVLHYVILRAYEPVAKMMAQRMIDKLKNQNR